MILLCSSILLVSEEQHRSLDEREGELRSKAKDSRDSESLEFGKPVRRNSNPFTPPYSKYIINLHSDKEDLHLIFKAHCM